MKEEYMTQRTRRRDYSDEAEIEQVRQVAEDALGLTFDRIVQSGSEANVVGIRSERVLFSQRLDSQTYFVQDSQYGMRRAAGVFKGSDEEQLETCHTILRRLRIPLSEIREENVLKEQTQVAQFDRVKGEIKLEEIEEGKNFVRILRQVRGLPVWSSSLILGLTSEKQIGFMQLHWPKISNHVVTEGHRLAYKVKHGWQPPELQGASVESVEAGIIHSPAIGFIMDIYPAIRVIYAPLDMRMGQKPVLYVNRDSKSVPIPRQVELPGEEPTRPRQAPTK
jgi:hypothetical protein